MPNKRKNLIITIIIILACIALFAGAFFAYKKLSQGYDKTPSDVSKNSDNEQNNNNPTENDTSTVPADDFIVYDSGGNEVRLSDLKGKPVVVNFWTSWCGPCKSEMPIFDAAYKMYGDKVEFMMVNLTDGSSETPDNAQDFLKANGYVFPLYHDLAQNAARTYKIYSIPLTLFINADGSVYTTHTGAMNEKTFSAYLEEIMK